MVVELYPSQDTRLLSFFHVTHENLSENHCSLVLHLIHLLFFRRVRNIPLSGPSLTLNRVSDLHTRLNWTFTERISPSYRLCSSGSLTHMYVLN